MDMIPDFPPILPDPVNPPVCGYSGGLMNCPFVSFFLPRPEPEVEGLKMLDSAI